MILTSAIISLASAIVTAFIAALIGFFLAKARFKHDQLWQEKNSTYKKVLGAVEAVRFWGDEVSSDTHFMPTVNWYDGKPAHQFYKEALREIHKQSVLGKAILSSGFIDALNQLLMELSQERYSAMEDRDGDPSVDHLSFGAHAAQIRNLADRHLEGLIELARSDLRA